MLLEPLRHKAFRRLAGGRAAAYLGNGIAPPALAAAAAVPTTHSTPTVRDLHSSAATSRTEP